MPPLLLNAYSAEMFISPKFQMNQYFDTEERDIFHTALQNSYTKEKKGGWDGDKKCHQVERDHGWMTKDFTFFSTMFQSYQDKEEQ